MEEFKKKEKLEFRDIILEHLKKILEVSSIEFRGGYIQERPLGNFILKEYVADSRRVYIQCIESFSDVLEPHFDAWMKKDYKKIIDDINKLKGQLETKKNEEDAGTYLDEYINNKLDLCRELFRKLNHLLQRKNYLAKRPVWG